MKATVDRCSHEESSEFTPVAGQELEPVLRVPGLPILVEHSGVTPVRKGDVAREMTEKEMETVVISLRLILHHLPDVFLWRLGHASAEGRSAVRSGGRAAAGAGKVCSGLKQPFLPVSIN